MKKLSTTIIILCLVLAVQAQGQDAFDPFKDRQLYFDCLNISAVLAVIYMISSFILKIMQGAYTFKLKNRMLDKGTEENIVKQLIQPDKKENRNYLLQWFFMLAAIGTGLILVTLIRPFGIHSVAIMAFSLAAGFGAYYYFTRQND
jgi:hypothetical protein